MSEALPLTSVTTPSEVVPSLNVTVPVGVPTAGGTGLTVAVSVTVCQITDGLGVELRLVVVGELTTWVTVGDVLPRKFGLAL